MAGHHEKPSTHGWEKIRNVGLGWSGMALIFGWPLTLPVLLTVATQMEIEAVKHWGGFRSKLKTVFSGPSHAAKH